MADKIAEDIRCCMVAAAATYEICEDGIDGSDLAKDILRKYPPDEVIPAILAFLEAEAPRGEVLPAMADMCLVEIAQQLLSGKIRAVKPEVQKELKAFLIKWLPKTRPQDKPRIDLVITVAAWVGGHGCSDWPEFLMALHNMLQSRDAAQVGACAAILDKLCEPEMRHVIQPHAKAVLTAVSALVDETPAIQDGAFAATCAVLSLVDDDELVAATFSELSAVIPHLPPRWIGNRHLIQDSLLRLLEHPRKTRAVALAHVLPAWLAPTSKWAETVEPDDVDRLETAKEIIVPFLASPCIVHISKKEDDLSKLVECAATIFGAALMHPTKYTWESIRVSADLMDEQSGSIASEVLLGWTLATVNRFFNEKTLWHTMTKLLGRKAPLRKWRQTCGILAFVATKIDAHAGAFGRVGEALVEALCELCTGDVDTQIRVFALEALNEWWSEFCIRLDESAETRKLAKTCMRRTQDVLAVFLREKNAACFCPAVSMVGHLVKDLPGLCKPLLVPETVALLIDGAQRLQDVAEDLGACLYGLSSVLTVKPDMLVGADMEKIIAVLRKACASPDIEDKTNAVQCAALLYVDDRAGGDALMQLVEHTLTTDFLKEHLSSETCRAISFSLDELIKKTRYERRFFLESFMFLVQSAIWSDLSVLPEVEGEVEDSDEDAKQQRECASNLSGLSSVLTACGPFFDDAVGPHTDWLKGKAIELFKEIQARAPAWTDFKECRVLSQAASAACIVFVTDRKEAQGMLDVWMLALPESIKKEDMLNPPSATNELLYRIDQIIDVAKEKLSFTTKHLEPLCRMASTALQSLYEWAVEKDEVGEEDEPIVAFTHDIVDSLHDAAKGLGPEMASMVMEVVGPRLAAILEDARCSGAYGNVLNPAFALLTTVAESGSFTAAVLEGVREGLAEALHRLKKPSSWHSVHSCSFFVGCVAAQTEGAPLIRDGLGQQFSDAIERMYKALPCRTSADMAGRANGAAAVLKICIACAAEPWVEKPFLEACKLVPLEGDAAENVTVTDMLYATLSDEKQSGLLTAAMREAILLCLFRSIVADSNTRASDEESDMEMEEDGAEGDKDETGDASADSELSDSEDESSDEDDPLVSDDFAGKVMTLIRDGPNRELFERVIKGMPAAAQAALRRSLG